MTLVKYRNPFRSLLSLDRVFDDFLPSALWGADTAPAAWGWDPLVDIYEKDDEIVLSAELPGMNEKDIGVSVEDNVVTISGERAHDEEVKKESYHRVERFYGKFERTFALPFTAKTDAITAEYKNGVLKLHIPKAEEAKPKKIPVKVG